MSMSDLSRRSVIAGGLAAAAAGAAAGSARAATSTSATPPAAENGWVTSTMARMTLEEKVGQLFIQNVYGKDATTPDEPQPPALRRREPGRGRAEVPPRRRHLLRVDRQRRRTPTRSSGLSNGLQRAALTQRSKVRIPLQIATDQEQGVVTRVGPPATQFPGSMALGAGRSAADARTAAAITGARAARDRHQHRLRARLPTSTSTRSTRSSACARSPPTRARRHSSRPPRSPATRRTRGRVHGQALPRPR